MISKTSVQNVRGAEENERPVLSTVSGTPSKAETRMHFEAQARLAMLDAIFAALDDQRTYIEVGDNAVYWMQEPETDPALASEPPGWVVKFFCGRGIESKERRFDTFLDALKAATGTH